MAGSPANVATQKFDKATISDDAVFVSETDAYATAAKTRRTPQSDLKDEILAAISKSGESLFRGKDKATHLSKIPKQPLGVEFVQDYP